MAQPSLPVTPPDGFGMQCSGGSLLRTPGRTSFRPEGVASSLGMFQPEESEEITATGAVAMLPQVEDLLDDHVLKRPPRAQPCEQALAIRKEFEHWQTRARTIMHAYAAAASQFFLRVVFVAWASNWQRPDAQAARRGCSAATSRSLTNLGVFLRAWSSESKRGAQAKQSMRLLSWSQDRALCRSVFSCWSSETLRLRHDAQLIKVAQRVEGSSLLSLAFDCWRAEMSRILREKKLLDASAGCAKAGQPTQRAAFTCWRMRTSRLRLQKKLGDTLARWTKRGQLMQRAAFACWRIETSRLRFGTHMLNALDRQTKAGQSIHKTAFASWRVETWRLRHHQQLLDSVSGWIHAEQSSGLVLWTFKEWQQMRPGDGQVEEAVAHNIENNQERMADCFFLWQSAMTRRLQMELRGARALEECWRQSATTLSVFRGWHHFARRSARIKVSLSASIFAFQRLVLGAWKLLVSRPGPSPGSKQFGTPRRPDAIHSRKEKDPGSRSTERSPMVLSEEQDHAKRTERNDKNHKNGTNGTEVNTKMSRPRTLLEQLHWKAAQFSHPEPGAQPVKPDRSKDPKNLPTPNRRGEARKVDGPKERIARQVTRTAIGQKGGSSEEPLAQLRLKLQDLQNFSADA